MAFAPFQTSSGGPAAGGGPPASPCVKVCALDARGYCIGCARSIDEISRWIEMSDEEKARVIASLDERRARLR